MSPRGDGILAAPELLTFFVFGDDDRFYEYMHSVVMPFGVAINALLGAIVGSIVHFICRLFVASHSDGRPRPPDENNLPVRPIGKKEAGRRWRLEQVGAISNVVSPTA